jgi:hypothetical protein
VGHVSPNVNVVIVVEFQKPLSDELSVIVSNDRISYPKIEKDILDEIHGLSGTDFGYLLHLDPLSKFVYHDKQVG